MNIQGTFRTRSHDSDLPFHVSTSGAFSVNATGSGSNHITRTTGNSTTETVTFNAASNWTGETSQSGADTAHNNIPPVKAAYAWKRTA